MGPLVLLLPPSTCWSLGTREFPGWVGGGGVHLSMKAATSPLPDRRPCQPGEWGWALPFSEGGVYAQGFALFDLTWCPSAPALCQGKGWVKEA